MTLSDLLVSEGWVLKPELYDDGGISGGPRVRTLAEELEREGLRISTRTTKNGKPL